MPNAWGPKLQAVSDNVGSDWMHLAHNLGLKKIQVDSINVEHQTTNEKAYQVLLKWKQKEKVPNINDLKIAVKKLGRDDLVELVDQLQGITFCFYLIGGVYSLYFDILVN